MKELNVLIAEPSKTGRHIFTQLINRLGVNVIFTADARETYAAAAKGMFNLICLSQKLPDEDGIQVCAHLRKIEEYRSTPIILITPQKDSINYDFAFSSGVTQLIGRHELHRFTHAVELLIIRSKPIEGRVLVVEDSRSQAEYISALLRDMGLTIDAVGSAETAIGLLGKHHYNLAIIDVVLAGNMTGVELVDYIRGQPEKLRSLRVLAMSAYEDASRRVKLFNLGIDDFIHKPIVREELIARARGLLSQHYIDETSRENARLSRSLSQLLDNSPDIIGRFDVMGRLLFMNPRMEAELGVVAAQEMGKHYRDLRLPDSMLAVYPQAITNMLNGSPVASYQCVGRNNIDFDVQFTPEIADGELVSFIVSARDITRLIELQRELLQSKEEVELASEAKSSFLATMSHELRTPLNAISGFGQLMFRKLNDGELVNSPLKIEFNEYLNQITQNSKQLTSLIGGILDLARIEADKLTFLPEVVDLAEIATSLRSVFSESCKEDAINLNIVFNNIQPEPLVLDKIKVINILNNLIENAIKFNHSGGRVDVDISIKDKQLVVWVKDSGIGIPPAGMTRIFEPFEQLDNSRTRYYGGSGLGLSIVRKLTEFLGGTINIESTKNIGTTCHLIIPLAEGDEIESPVEVVVPFCSHEFHGEKVLVVEDSIVNQQLMTAALSNIGLVVKMAENGAVGVHLCESWQPDIVLMDMHMPVMDGLEATRQIRKMEKFKDIPIFGLSADAHQEYIQKAFFAGITEYMTKPINFQKLNDLIRQYCHQVTSHIENIQSDHKDSEGANMAEETVLDPSKGIMYAANNVGLYKQLLQTFIEQYDKSGQQLTQFYQSGEYDAAMKLAHTMKGVCSTLGMNSLSKVAKLLQFAFDNNELSDVEQHLQRFDQLLAVALVESKKYCDD